MKGSCWPINILLFVSTLGNVRLKSFSLNKPVKFEYKRRLCISLFHTSVDFGNENVRKSIIYGIGIATISGPHKHVFGLCCNCLCFFHIVSPVSVVLIVCFWIRIVLFYFHLSPLTYTPWYGACMSSFYFSGLCYCILFVAYYVSIQCLTYYVIRCFLPLPYQKAREVRLWVVHWIKCWHCGQTYKSVHETPKFKLLESSAC